MRSVVIAVVLGIIAGVIYGVSPVTHSPDSRWVLPTAYSLVTEGDLGLNEYRPVIKKIGTYGLRRKNREFVNFFPVGPALVAAPFVAVIARYPAIASRVLDVPLDGTGENLLRHRRVVEHFIAAVVGALTVVLCFLTLAPLTTPGIAGLLTLGVAFGSSLWSVGTRGLWQHAPAMLCLFGALAIIARIDKLPRDRRRWIWGGILGLALAASYLMRPTASLAIIALGLFLLVRARWILLPTVSGALVVAVPFVASNLGRYGHLLSPYYRGAELALTPTVFEAMAANLVSPSRGLLVLSSWVCVALFSLSRPRQPLALALWGWCCLHLVVISTFDRWWGGHSFGPRFMGDIVPALAVLGALGLSGSERRSRVVHLILRALVGLSVLAHAPGALSYTTVLWNRYPRDIDGDPRRIWSVRWMQSGAPLYLRVVRPANVSPSVIESSREEEGSD